MSNKYKPILLQFELSDLREALSHLLQQAVIRHVAVDALGHGQLVPQGLTERRQLVPNRHHNLRLLNLQHTDTRISDLHNSNFGTPQY